MTEIDREYPSLRAHLIGMVGIFAALFAGLSIYLYLTTRSMFVEALQRELSGDLKWIASMAHERPTLLADPIQADSLCNSVFKHKKYRLTLIGKDGRVLADSHVPRSKLSTVENHVSRPEIVMAAQTGWGHAWRRSATVNLRMLYVACWLEQEKLYLRIAAGPTTIDNFQMAFLKVFALFLALFLSVVSSIAWWISRRITSPLLYLTEDGSPAPALSGHPPRWEARFREAEVLNQAFQGYVGQVRSLAGEIEKQRDKLVAVLNQLEEGIIILSSDGLVVTANPSSLKLLGTDHEAGHDPWIGRPFREVLPDSALARWVDEVENPDRTPLLHVDKGPNSPFDLLCHLAPLGPATGSESGALDREFLLTLINVSEFRHLDRVKSEFVANASHELKTPLSSLKGYAEALLEGALDNPKVREPFVKKIHNNALRLERLVQDLLSLSHLEANPVPKETESLTLRGYVNAAANLHRHAMDGVGVRLENHVGEDIRLTMESRDLELILNNLVGNAVKYNKPGGKVKLWTEMGESLKLFVKDTGIGIPEEMLPRIFERFYRAGASRASKEGTGLGLAIVKHAAHKYGMSVSADSILGEGSRFVIEIPLQLIGRRHEGSDPHSHLPHR